MCHVKYYVFSDLDFNYYGPETGSWTVNDHILKKPLYSKQNTGTEIPLLE